MSTPNNNADEQPNPKLNEGKGIPGLKAPTPDQMPPEEAHQVGNISTNNEGLYGEFTDEDRQIAHEDSSIGSGGGKKLFDEDQDAVEWFQKKTVEGFKYWAQFTQFRIKMDDGRVVTYERVPITKYQSDELMDLSAEIQAGRDLNTDKILSVTKVRQKQRQHDIMKALYYLRDVATGKPMTADQLKHVGDSTIIDSILEACYAITIAKWAEGKK